jgi:hypothetical protein
LQAGGINLDQRPEAAADYGPYLKNRGFKDVSAEGYKPQKGDVAVFAAFKGHKYGHIEIYSGNQWVSDFKQNYFTPGAAFRDPPDPYKLYRFKQ